MYGSSVSFLLLDITSVFGLLLANISAMCCFSDVPKRPKIVKAMFSVLLSELPVLTRNIRWIYHICFAFYKTGFISLLFSYWWQMCNSGSLRLFHTLFPLATEILVIAHQGLFLAGLVCRIPKSLTGIFGRKKPQYMSQLTRAFWFMVAKVYQLTPFDLGFPKE